jgi:AAA family ATP:ADP antiporter
VKFSAGTERGNSYGTVRNQKARAAILFTNFFLIIMALYQLKPASRSMFIESLGADRLPYVWIGTALIMGILITYYNRLVARHSRIRVVLGSCLLVSGLLVAFRIWMIHPNPVVQVAFFMFVDIQSVVLVEQFWSLTDSTHTTRQGKKWYGIVGTGGLAGGVAGGEFSKFLVEKTAMQTPDLALSAAATIFLIFILTWGMGRLGLYCEVVNSIKIQSTEGGWGALRHSRYLMLIAAILLLAQLVDPVIDYQFLKTVQSNYPEQEARTVFLSWFFSRLSAVSIVVNLVVTPLVHRFAGAIGGLLVQPLMISIFSWGFMLHNNLFFAGAAKISDRGLSYSINRASKELLYIPIPSVLLYQAKAWIDMVGYRVFKISGSLLILFFTQWLPVSLSVPQLSWFVLMVCIIWVSLIFMVRPQYYSACQQALVSG